MEEQNWLAQQFEEHRIKLTKVAYRMLGSAEEADDAVQEAWVRLRRSDAAIIDNLVGWLTTVVARICMDILRQRVARREDLLDIEGQSGIVDSRAIDPEREAILADSIGPALLVVLDTLTPPERVAFVLHDLFGMPFEEIGPIVGRSVAAARQLASRARRRVQGSAAVATDTPDDNQSERRIVDAFLTAAREGNFEALLTVLDPECRLRADEYAALMGAPRQAQGNQIVANFFNGRASEASRATINGVAAAAWTPAGSVRVAFNFAFRNGKIIDIELIGDRKRLQTLDIVLIAG